MIGRFVLTVTALCIAAWLINMAPSWSIVVVVLCLGGAWSLLALDHKWESERKHRALEPVKGRQR